MSTFDYRIHPRKLVMALFDAERQDLSASPELDRLRKTIADGYRWVRTETDTGSAVFEKVNHTLMMEDFTDEMNAGLAELLRAYFPWLETDDAEQMYGGADIIDELTKLYASLTLADNEALDGGAS